MVMEFLILMLYPIYYQLILTSLSTRFFFYKLILGSWFMGFFLSNKFKSVFKLLRSNRGSSIIGFKKKIVKGYKKLMMSHTNISLNGIFKKLLKMRELLEKQKSSLKQDDTDVMVNLKAYKNNILI